MSSSSSCTTQLNICTGNLSFVTSSYLACGCNASVVHGITPSSDECSSEVPVNYDLPLHVGSVFIILFMSVVGSVLPLIGKYNNNKCGIDPFLVALGKCVGTGIVLACALIHMLQPAAASLTSICVPVEFSQNYTAYAYCFAMIAGLFMHFFETMMRLIAKRNMPVKPTSDGKNQVEEELGSHSHGPTTGMIDGQHMIQMYSMEFALTVHSVFIGLTVGIVADSELHTLLVALSFHQFFEGVALGSRLADAAISLGQCAAFISIFSLSSPIGIMVGIITSTTVNPRGVTYLLTQGIFDGFCAGILLYVGFQLMFFDFPVDFERFCAGKSREMVRRASMFVALWLGAGLMAFIGRYL